MPASLATVILNLFEDPSWPAAPPVPGEEGTLKQVPDEAKKGDGMNGW
jgi:hypothetical protein